MNVYPITLGATGLGDSAWGEAIIEATNQEIELRNQAISEALTIESIARNEAIKSIEAKLLEAQEQDDQATYNTFKTSLNTLKDRELNAVSIRNELFKRVLVALTA